MASSAVARTPLHHWHVAQGARWSSSDGWQLPAAYTTLERETAAARSAVALADLSAFAKISARGCGVPALARALLGEEAVRPHRVVRFTADGPALACILTPDHLLLLAGSTASAALRDRLRSLAPDQSVVTSDVTSAYAGFGIIGPKAEELLRKLTALDVSEAGLPGGSCAESGLAGVQALLLRAPELTVPSLRIHVSWDVGEYVWERLLHAGRGLDLTPLGIDGWRSLLAAGP
jgi:heterotetrameric sarcosine oxidase gamma subunit